MLTVIPRSAWGAAPPTTPLVPVTWRVGGPLWLHHTVGSYVAPEGAPPATGTLVWTGKDAPNMRTLAIRHPGKVLDAVAGPNGKWRVYARPTSAKAARAIWLANVTKVKAAERRAMREIQRFHQQGRGWSDIGYGFVAFASGRVYEGRGEYHGAHCPGHNHEPSVALAGDYSAKKPTTKQHLAVARLKARIFAGSIKGHRDGFPTSCPGDAAYKAFGLDR